MYAPGLYDADYLAILNGEENYVRIFGRHFVDHMKRVALSGIFVLRPAPATIPTQHMNAILPAEAFLVLGPGSPVPHGYGEWGFMRCDGMPRLLQGLVVALRDQNPSSLAFFLNAAKFFAPDGSGDPEVYFVYVHLKLKFAEDWSH